MKTNKDRKGIKSNSFHWPANATKWEDIYSWLKSIGCNKTSGALLEIFCKHFLLTHPNYSKDYKNVWLQKEVKPHIKRKLNLSDIDHGDDLILERKDGALGVVQCKFTSKQERKILNWTKDNLSSWLAISSKADFRVLFTNASGIDSATERKGKEKALLVFDLSHLLELTRTDIRNIFSSIKGQKIKYKKHTPRSYQLDAINAVVRGFDKDDRGQLILPCGAGKTETSLWIKEKLKPKRTLVLVPSLALLRQFKDSWKKQENKPSEYFCVCSEKDIGSQYDSPETNIFELGTEVTTNATKIKKLLTYKKEVVVFATYQSSHVIEDALRNTNVKFDLILFDEAHRTAGVRKKSAFTTTLDDKKIYGQKRLFMTATPRILDPNIKNLLKDNQRKCLASMDDPKVYGKEYYRMHFADAIRNYILVDYKIIAVGVTNKELQHAVKERVYADSTTLDEVANNYALNKVMKKYKIKHAVTFHSTVEKARKFKERHERYYKKTDSFHVNGSQATSYRSACLEEFKEAKKSVITNARCLNEGIDVKAIDCVYFCDPKSSKIDIIQATGRALRRCESTNKKSGYVVVPIFHRDVNKLELDIKSGVYKNLVAVVRALADQDQRIEDEIRDIFLCEGSRKNNKANVRIHLDKFPKFEFVGFKTALKKSIFTQIISKAIVSWRSYDEAKKWIKPFKFKTSMEYKKWTKGEVKELPPRPNLIPANPYNIYKNKGWINWGDYLGSKNISNKDVEFRSYVDAQKYVQSLKTITTGNQYTKWSKGETKGLPPRPSDIPGNPSEAYKNKGWTSWGNLLGTTITMRSYDDAQKYVQSLKTITTGNQYTKWSKGETKGLPPRPSDIPGNPSEAYKNKGWTSWGNFLGTGRVANFNIKRWNYNRARKFVNDLGLKDTFEWWEYCKGKIKYLPNKPNEIPTNPQRVYKKSGWKGWGAWLGNNAVATFNRKYLAFLNARSFVRKLKLNDTPEWRDYCKGKIKGLPLKPPSIPNAPASYYKGKGWIDWGDFLGSGFVATQKRNFLAYEEAKRFVQPLKLPSQIQYRKWCNNKIKGLPIKSSNIPSNPNEVYKNSGWIGYGEFLGTGRIATRSLKFKRYDEAKKYIQSLKTITTGEQYKKWSKGEIKGLSPRPCDIPGNPYEAYKNKGWISMGDYLGVD